MELAGKTRKLSNSFVGKNNERDDINQPATKKPRLSKFSGVGANMVEKQASVSMADLQRCLYNPRSVQLINPQDMAQGKQEKDCFWCDASFAKLNFKCPLHKPENRANQQQAPQQAPQQPLAVRSLPPEVGLCLSNIPGAGYGVCAKRVIPVGAWIGPYEGKFVKPEELSSVADTSYMWEVYKDDKLAGFIDGSDETVSSWMRYIRCARHKQEQNLFAFQYMGKVYYRSFKAILPGHEMLVWYDEKYPQYLGIPSSIFDLGCFIPSGTKNKPDNNKVDLTSEEKDRTSPEDLILNQAPPTPPSSVPSPASPGSPSSNSQPIMSQYYSPTRPISSEPLNGTQSEMTSAFDFTSALSRTEKEPITTANTLKENVAPNQSPAMISGYDTPTNSDGEGSPVKLKEPCFTSITELSLWKCGQCKKSFPQRTMLQIHICAQAPKKPYQCGHCSESFSLPTELRAHAVIHASKKPFKCGYCSRAFAGSTTLNNHIRTHTGERPFVCETCGKNFTQGSQLSRHQRIPGDCVARA